MLLVFVMLFGIMAPFLQPSFAKGATSSSDTLLPLVGDALTQARAKDWPKVAADLQAFETAWHSVSQHDTQITEENHQQLDASLAAAKAAVQSASPQEDAVSSALKVLAKSTNQLSAGTKQPSTGSSSVKKDLQTLAGLVQQSLQAVQQQDVTHAKSQFRQFEAAWPRVEANIRQESVTAYATIETKQSLAHVALNAQPLDAKRAESALQDLLQAVQDDRNDKAAAAPTAGQTQSGSDASQRPATGTGTQQVPSGDASEQTHSVSDLLQLLTLASQQAQSGDASDAANTMVQFIELWPSVEGHVQTRSAQAYSDIEVKMTHALQDLSATPPNLSSAQNTMSAMRAVLESFADQAHYTAWDAGLVLFREGLEALLVVSALLAFLNRTGQRKKQAWIWTGVGSGLLVSAAFAVVMTVFFSSIAAGGNREVIEGVTGLLAVVLMFTVGMWLHSKSSGKAWSQYINQQMDTALAKGSLWSLALLSFLAIVREGAETIIFYLGMASAIDTSQLLLGIGGALLLLVILGAAIIRFSMRIPIKPFFTMASLFIYYIAFKFLGQSIHVLQIENWIPTHTLSGLSTIEWLSLYPTWESTVAQFVLLLLIAFSMLWNGRKAAGTTRAKSV